MLNSKQKHKKKPIVFHDVNLVIDLLNFETRLNNIGFERTSKLIQKLDIDHPKL